MLARAGARSGRVAESDGATGQAVTGPRDFGPHGRCTHIGVGARRDRFSTIEKRRCDCAGGRAQSASVSASDGAPAQAVCRLPRFGKLALQLAPDACTQECNSYLCTLMTSQTVRDSSSRRTVPMGSLGGLPVNVEHVPQPCAYTHPIGHVHLVQRISTLDIEGRGDRWSGDSGPGATNERRRHLTAIRELTR